MNNRLHNCTNPNQGSYKKVLCVCSAGLLRSPTAANVLHTEFGFNTRAVGVDKGHALIPLDSVHLAWADEVVCMEEEHTPFIHTLSTNDEIPLPKITVLNIPDMFGYMDKELQEMILLFYRKSHE